MGQLESENDYVPVFYFANSKAVGYVTQDRLNYWRDIN